MVYEQIAVFVVALVVLAKSSSLAVKYAVKFAKITGINQMAVGFLLLAISTSLPELMVAVLSLAAGESIIGFSTALGSSIGDLTIILGIAALAGFSIPKRDGHNIESALVTACIIILFAVVLQAVSIAFALFSLLIFSAYMNVVIKDGIPIKNNKVHGLRTIAMVKDALYVITAALAVAVSAHFLVNSAVAVASAAGISKALIGATIIAFGSFMPELTLTITAMRKRNVELALGDAAGSVITNIALIGGIASLGTIHFNSVTTIASLFFIGAGVAVYALVKRRKFRKGEGLFLVSLYIAFIAAMILLAS